jgi:hypothetical protein
MSSKPKLRIATTSLAGCFGCHTSFLDIDERLLELVELVAFDRSPLTDIKHCGPCDIGLRDQWRPARRTQSSRSAGGVDRSLSDRPLARP